MGYVMQKDYIVILMVVNASYSIKRKKVNNLYCWDDTTLWHQRFDYPSLFSLKSFNVKKSGYLSIYNKCPKNICECCIMGNMQKLPFIKTSWRVEVLPQLVHYDIWGLANDDNLEKKDATYCLWMIMSA